MKARKKKKGNWGDDYEDDFNPETSSSSEESVVEEALTPAATNSPFVLICDEAHKIQSMETAQTKGVLKLAMSQSCVGVLLLTGTPMNNGKPLNVFPLLRAIRHELANNQKKYETRYCDGRMSNFGGRQVWDAKGSSNLKELQVSEGSEWGERSFTGTIGVCMGSPPPPPLLQEKIGQYMLRKTKEEVLKDLPARRRELRFINLGKQSYMKYKHCLSEMLKHFTHNKATNTYTPKEKSADSNAVMGVLVKVAACASRGKAQEAAAIAFNVLQAKDAVVLYTGFVKTAHAIKEELEGMGVSCGVLTGETKLKDRHTLVEDFQAGHISAFIGTFGAAGTGITLTAASTIILVDRPWRPGDCFQAEDRIRRIGQKEQCHSIWLQAFAWDKQVDELIKAKEQNINAVLNKESSGQASTSSLSVTALLTAMTNGIGGNQQMLSQHGFTQEEKEDEFDGMNAGF